jgi:hypothetical protein
MTKPISVLLAFVFISIGFIIISFKQENERLNTIITQDKIVIDSLKEEIEIELFDKNRYISIIDQLSITNCKEVKQIIYGTE